MASAASADDGMWTGLLLVTVDASVGVTVGHLRKEHSIVYVSK